MKLDPAAGSNHVACDLNGVLRSAGLKELPEITLAKFEIYLSLILRWNARMNLTSIRAAGEIVQRHFVESIACAQFLPHPIETLLDFGSGAGFPGIPIALCRPEVSVTLAESQGKKAAFLQESVRTLKLSARVWSRRGEDLDEVFDCVVLRAVDRMEQAIASASRLVRPGGWLGLLVTEDGFGRNKAAVEGLEWSRSAILPGSRQRILALALNPRK